MSIVVSNLPLTRLKALAENGPDAATRAAAKREIEARTGATAAPEIRAQVTTVTTEYGTPQPELQLKADGAVHPRELRALAYDCAAKLERALVRSPDGWLISTRLDDTQAAVVVELMTGSDPERDRALALLRAIAPVTGPKKRGRKPKSTEPRTDSRTEAAPEPTAKSASAPRKPNGATAPAS